MFALMILLAIGIYLLMSIWVVSLSIGHARKHQLSVKKWGWGAALVMFLIPFWDWLPTVAVHKYYCEKEAGFWVYKTLEQWKVENPGVMEGLHQMQQPRQKTDYGDIDILDERFALETHRSNPIPLLVTNIADRRLVDRKTGEILAKAVDVGSGVGYMATSGGFKFWLNQNPCLAGELGKLAIQLDQMRGQK